MYEKPELIRIGDAEDVILGWAVNGGDIDLNWSSNQDELEGEVIPDLISGDD